MPKMIDAVPKSDRLRILLITGIFPPDIGGPATYVPQIASELTKRGHEITVVTLSDHTNHDDRHYPFRLVRLRRKIFKPWRWISTVWNIIKLGKDANVLFVNGLAMEAVIANFFLRRPTVLKIVSDFAWERATSKGWTKEHFELFQSQRHNLKIEILKNLRKWWTSRADKAIVPSQYLAKWVSKWGISRDRLEIVHNAVETFGEIVPMDVLLRTPLKAVTVGRLIPLKRVYNVIETLAKLDNIGLVVVGDGPERPLLEEATQRFSMEERIYFAGQRDIKETLCLMAGCNFIILNSTHEGFPHVLIEAMKMGLPAVATAVGGIPEIIEHEGNGLLVSPTDDKALRNAIERLISQPKELQRLSAGTKNTSERFSLEQMVEETERVLLEVIMRKKKAF